MIVNVCTEFGSANLFFEIYEYVNYGIWGKQEIKFYLSTHTYTHSTMRMFTTIVCPSNVSKLFLSWWYNIGVHLSGICFVPYSLLWHNHSFFWRRRSGNRICACAWRPQLKGQWPSLFLSVSHNDNGRATQQNSSCIRWYYGC